MIVKFSLNGCYVAVIILLQQKTNFVYQNRKNELAFLKGALVILEIIQKIDIIVYFYREIWTLVDLYDEN